jgi:8-oxo-dGTP pyrophosphatase MutT (NUDIX family)
MIHVVSGCIEKKGRWLVGKRARPFFEGTWEMPGGKKEMLPGPPPRLEDDHFALDRELREELGVTFVSFGRPLVTTPTLLTPDGREFRVTLIEAVSSYEPTCNPAIHSELAWCTLPELEDLKAEEMTPSLPYFLSALRHNLSTR